MLSDETKIDWQFIQNEELLNKLVIEVNRIASKYWNDKGLDNYSNAGLVSRKEEEISQERKRSLLDCQDVVQEYMLSLIEGIRNDRDYSFIFAYVKKGIKHLIIDEIRRRNPIGNVKSEFLKKRREFEKLSPHEQTVMKDKLAIEKPNEYKKVFDPDFIKKIEDSFFQEQYLDHGEIEPAYSRRMHELIDPEEKIHQNICLTKLDDFLASGVIDDECLKIFKFLRAGVEPKDIIKELNINHNEKYRRKEKNCFKKYRFM